MGKKWKQWQTIFLGCNVTADGEYRYEIKRCLLLGRKAMTNLDSILKKQKYYFADKGLSSQSYGFPCSHVGMWELYHNEGWAPMNWCFETVVLRVPCTARRTNQSILKDINPEYSLEGLMLKLQHFDHLIQRDPDAGKDWGQEEKGKTEDEMVGWHHWLNGHEFEQTLGDSEEQGSLAC